MQSASSPARRKRAHYRHEMRTLTYVTLDAANGGIIRNLNRHGAALQAVAALQPEQRVRLRFELKLPLLRVETYGQVSWSNVSGQCGVRFVNLPDKTARKIDEWIFSNLLDTISRYEEGTSPISASPSASSLRTTNSAKHKVCAIEVRREPSTSASSVAEWDKSDRRNDQLSASGLPSASDNLKATRRRDSPVSRLSRPLSTHFLAQFVDTLVIVAALLFFALVFLSITQEMPPWPIAVGGALFAALFVAAAYWGLCSVLEGASLGARLAKSANARKKEFGEIPSGLP